MRIVTNFFLANITIANLLYTVCVPFQIINEIKIEYIFGNVACRLLPILSTLSVNVNTFTMIAASMERLIVIVYPFKCKLTKSKCILIIGLIWLTSLLASLPWGYFLTTSEEWFDQIVNEILAESNNETTAHKPSIIMNENSSAVAYNATEIDEANSSTESDQFDAANNNNSEYYLNIMNPMDQCGVFSKPKKVILGYYFLFLCIVQYLLPLVVLSITYIIIAYYMYWIKSEMDSHVNNKCHNNILNKNKKKFIKMLILVIICFNVCWLPLQLGALINAIYPDYIQKKL